MNSFTHFGPRYECDGPRPGHVKTKPRYVWISFVDGIEHVMCFVSQRLQLVAVAYLQLPCLSNLENKPEHMLLLSRTYIYIRICLYLQGVPRLCHMEGIIFNIVDGTFY